jgi:hypothetical protein
VADTTPRSARDALLAALRRIVRPLLRICFRTGVSMAEIRAVLDHAAVQEAEAYLVENEKKPTYSNISIITGIQRRQVTKLLQTTVEEGPPPTATALHRAVRVLNGWHEDPHFTTRDGRPAELDVRGGAKSFEALVHRYAGGITQAPILERLVETGTVEVTARDPDGRPLRVRPLQSTLAPDVNQTRLFDEFGVLYAEALEMFDTTLRSTNPVERMRPYSVSAIVRRPQLKVLRRQLKERGESLQAFLDEALDPHDVGPAEFAQLADQDPDSLVSVRVTMFSTIRPAVARKPQIESAWRREAEGREHGEPRRRNSQLRPRRK